MSLVHHVILAVLFLTVGCCVGSFLNVCVFRIPRGLSLLRPGSRCPRCRAPIRAYDNVPVLGWLWLRGRCRDCGCAISIRYPLVEFGVGLAFAGVYLAEAAVTSGELWERTGALVVLIPLLMVWTVISIVVVVGLTLLDARASSARLADASGVCGQDQGLSYCEHACRSEPILVQFGDLVGAAGIPQSVAGDTAEGLVRPNDVDRRSTSPAVACASRR
jgi:hypothetical protein